MSLSGLRSMIPGISHILLVLRSILRSGARRPVVVLTIGIAFESHPPFLVAIYRVPSGLIVVDPHMLLTGFQMSQP